MGAAPDRVWQYPEVDTLVIVLWPLVKAYNWTYRDLLNIIRPSLTRPKAYPCDREQDFATYCVNVLGLRKKGKGVTVKKWQAGGLRNSKTALPGAAGRRSVVALDRLPSAICDWRLAISVTLASLPSLSTINF